MVLAVSRQMPLSSSFKIRYATIKHNRAFGGQKESFSNLFALLCRFTKIDNRDFDSGFFVYISRPLSLDEATIQRWSSYI